MEGTRSKIRAVIVAGLVAATTLLPNAALAANSPSAGDQTGSGTTDVTVVLNLPDGSYGGPEVDPDHNPDGDGDGYGDNIAFSVPASINYVANAQGVMTGPSKSVTYIENHSAFGIHVSKFDVDAYGGWTITDKDATTHPSANSADFQFGLKGANATNTEVCDAYDYLDGKSVEKPGLWNMTYATGTKNKVEMETEGHIFNVDKDISGQTKIAIIKTYVSPKLAPTA